MATNRQLAARLVRDGASPSEIAEQWGTKIAQIRLYLLEQIAEGELFGTDVLRSISADTKHAYETYVQESESDYYWDLVNGCTEMGFSREEFRLYLDCRDSFRRDMYTYMSRLEVFVHEKIHETLVAEFGQAETGWWRKGIPEQIRISCVTSREADPYPPGEPYAYTTFIQLSNIIQKNWNLFSSILPSSFASDKKLLTQTLNRLNGIRNAVMHPVKRVDYSEDDFLFLRESCESLGDRREWRG
jgi:hypothetical protein